MLLPRLSNLEMRISWRRCGRAASFPPANPQLFRPEPARLLTVNCARCTGTEAKKHCGASKIATAFIFEAARFRASTARRRLIDDFLAVFGGENPAHHDPPDRRRENATLGDVQDAERHLRKISKRLTMRFKLLLRLLSSRLVYRCGSVNGAAVAVSIVQGSGGRLSGRAVVSPGCRGDIYQYREPWLTRSISGFISFGNEPTFRLHHSALGRLL